MGHRTPHAALFWCWLLYTGFRHEEGANVLWGDVDLSGPTPGISLRPEVEGNKATRREWQPIHPRLVPLLLAHRQTVPNRTIDRVFPTTPGDNSFEIARMAAGLPKKWPDGSPLTIHSLRVTFSTWLDQTGCPQGLRELLVRHRNGGITTSRYRPASMEERWNAVAKLPWVWPYNPPGPPVTPRNLRQGRIYPPNWYNLEKISRLRVKYLALRSRFVMLLVQIVRPLIEHTPRLTRRSRPPWTICTLLGVARRAIHSLTGCPSVLRVFPLFQPRIISPQR